MMMFFMCLLLNDVSSARCGGLAPTQSGDTLRIARPILSGHSSLAPKTQER